MHPNRGGMIVTKQRSLIYLTKEVVELKFLMTLLLDAETQGRNTVEQITTAGDTVNTASIDVSVAGPLNVSTADPSTREQHWYQQYKAKKGKSKIVEPEPTPKNLIKAQIQRDAEIAQRFFKEDQAQFERKQRISREIVTEQEDKDAALIEQMEDI
ncbi:hypothetical protein Tco_1354577 [Tanacetum coccineum]